MLSETAKDIAGYEGKYSVTTDGRVYSHSRVDACGRLQKGRWLNGLLATTVTSKPRY